MDIYEKVQKLNDKKEKYKQMGSEKYIEKQHNAGKLTVRERISLLLDEGSFMEMGLLAHQQNLHPTMEGKYTPADGVVTGRGTIDGRPVCIAAHDYTVLAGSTGKVAEKKMYRVREWSLKHRVPMIWLIDSAGVRIQESIGSLFADNGRHFFDEVKMSGVVPLVCAMMGPGVAGTAYLPALADFVPMVKGTSFMALGGPHLVRAVVGEDVDDQTLGGSKVHTEESGVADIEVENDEECINVIKQYLSFFPSNCEEKPPVNDLPETRNEISEKLMEIVPSNSKRIYNMYDVIKEIVDDGEYLAIKPKWAQNIITVFARVGGMPVGIVANQPRYMGGALDGDAADKAARFINICDAYSIPLVFLQDIPGFIVGSKVEKKGIIRHGAKMLHAVSEATVPKITVIVRKAYGAGYFVMCGKQYDPDLIVAWPTAEISVMGAEGASSILYHKQIANSENPKEAWNEYAEQFKELIDVDIAASNGLIDDVIDPRDTRRVIYDGLKNSWNKKVERPWKKTSIRPV
ncbi:acyl-CoA carboxylase subunit beta [Ornithinibacillus halophilus]|uniref:Acetyl-CoA carboxylase, carboxyltransferase component n=1 Tax=Ornithinibacillus halophilus TaxID=930117 RepID=A0A1M5GKU9_9BACI|nr:acyl-CoA carboxylase subunit beta [Ornithinibacillus halophilus]SHG04323.1 Acetyl-CoA carboxylase, carboxyltransferase component [Ornithinibacillus halophilus]